MGLSAAPQHRTLALIVHPARGEREAYAEYLSQHGVSTAQAEDGLHGIAKAASLLPDVITADLRMSPEDVADMCLRLRQQTSTRHIPIVAVTENGTPSEVARATRAGCTSVLVKPCSPSALLGEIRRVLALPEPEAE